MGIFCMTQRRIYQNEFPYFVTFRTREGFALFEDAETAALLSGIMFNAGILKQYNILAYQIMPEHVHLLTQCIITDRTLERVRSGNEEWILSQTERTFSNVRSSIKKQHTISDLI
jgi:REP element-mobilizing transposase RayT